SLFFLVLTRVSSRIQVILSTFAAYGLARFKFRGRNFFSMGLLVTQMFPPVLLIIPIYLIMINLRLVNTYAALVITYCTFAVPFSTWMLYGYFETLPAELEEAALVDGCSRLGTLFRIIIPLAAPGIAAVALFSFILSWQEYMFALTLTRTAEMRTLPVGISMLVGFREVLWGQLMAGSVIVTVPVVVLFVYFQKYLIKGLTMGAIKG
ncbi:MAG: carbohydrate ABC transporter permease, partial [Bacillota bacterium]